MMTKSNKEILKIISANLLELFLGTLIFLVGLLVFYTKMAGSRYGLSLEGTEAQISGASMMLFGGYRVWQAIRKTIRGLKNTDT